ncbi:autophagy protein atg9 [Coemansia sp. RSA 1813]|nr:autophagy protein atg9 [Coemansia sp. RSA 1813]
MLSSGISSRLRQLQLQRQSQRVSADDSQQPPSSPSKPPVQECASIGHARLAPRAEFPARKGLAADLINKFNQMSSLPASATVGRAPASGPPSRGGTAQALFSPLEPAATDVDSSSVSSQPLVAVQEGPVERQTACSSQFLTDAELDRALLEILEFSRDMNICLFDDDTAAADARPNANNANANANASANTNTNNGSGDVPKDGSRSPYHPATLRVASTPSPPESEAEFRLRTTSVASGGARTRGLTSALSGRRQRHDTPRLSSPEDGAQSRPYANLYDSQASIDTPVFSDRRSDAQEMAPWASPRLHPAQRHASSRKQQQPGRRSSLDNDADYEDELPPESLLIEVPEQHSPPAATTRQPTVSWDTPKSRPQTQSTFGGTYQRQQRSSGPAGFVRRAAHAVQTRIQEISSQAADAPRLGVPMPPPRHHSHHNGSEEAFGDGRVFSVADVGASAAWTRGGTGRRRPHARDDARLSYRERALRAWRDSKHQDDFFCRVYAYYVGKGAVAMVLARALQLATLAFVVVLSTFVVGCIDHAKVREQKSLSAVVIPQCSKGFSWPVTLCLWAFAAFWVAQAARTVADVPALLEIRAFFVEVLGVSSADIATVAWHEVVGRMVRLRTAEIREYRNLTKSRILGYRLTADGIVNRVMRRENYMIALFNRDLLDTRIPLLGRQQMLTKALEWNLSFCLLNYVFDERGQLRKRFLRESNRAILSEGLRRRFKFMAVINLMFAPFLVVFLVLYSFFRYFEELYHEPGAVMSRAFTPYAKYKFRNFNEVPHSFRRRIGAAQPKATLYLSQFRNEALISLARFVAFVSGSFMALLLALTVVDNELSLEFEITSHRTVLFYIGLFGAILAGARGMVPSDDQEYLHPAWIIRDVLEDLQYMEPEWRGKLDSTRVRRDFERLFTLKLAIFAQELLGVVTAPFIMLFSLPDCAEHVIDFFRDFTVHAEGLGYVCSFAAFDFEKHGNVRFSAPTRAANEHMASRNGKMEQSFLAFKADYPEWQPRNQAASIYLQRAQNAQHDLWRMDSIGHGAGWQDRLLQQQRMAGSVFPTGASLYHPRQQPQPDLGAIPSAAVSIMAPLPEHPPTSRPTTTTTATAAATTARPPGSAEHRQAGYTSNSNNGGGNTARSQFAFQPPGFNNLPQQQQQQLQSMASQAMLPFGPTLQGTTGGKGKRPEDQNEDTGAPTERLALSSLPLVASREMDGYTSPDSTTTPFGRAAPAQAGIFSIINQLYDQRGP